MWMIGRDYQPQEPADGCRELGKKILLGKVMEESVMGEGGHHPFTQQCK